MQQVRGTDAIEHDADGRLVEEIDDMRLRAGDDAVGLDDNGVHLGAARCEGRYRPGADEAGGAGDQDSGRHRV